MGEPEKGDRYWSLMLPWDASNAMAILAKIYRNAWNELPDISCNDPLRDPPTSELDKSYGNGYCLPVSCSLKELFLFKVLEYKVCEGPGSKPTGKHYRNKALGGEVVDLTFPQFFASRREIRLVDPREFDLSELNPKTRKKVDLLNEKVAEDLRELPFECRPWLYALTTTESTASWYLSQNPIKSRRI